MLACGPSLSESSAPSRGLSRGHATDGAKNIDAPALSASQLAEVSSRTFGPYLGRSAKGSLVVWAEFAGGIGHFSAVPVSQQGKPLGSVRELGQISESLRLVALRPTESGFVLAHTESTSEGERIAAVCLSARGDQQGEISELTTVRGRAVWLEVVRAADTALVFYGSLGDAAKGTVEIGVIPLDELCRAGTRTTVVRDARAWQVTPLADAALLSVVRPAANAAKAERSGGNVEAYPVDAKGKPGSSISISSEGFAEADLDAARIGDNVVLAWSDGRSIEPRVFAAAVDANRKVQVAAHPLTPPEGEQALLQLVPPFSGGTTGYVAWENLSERRPSDGRIIQIAAIDASGQLAPERARLEYASLDGLAPELAVTRRGLAALTIAPVCLADGELGGAACDGTTLAPVYVEVDRTLRGLAAEPLRLDALAGAPAEHAFNLACTEDGCLSLAALRREPAPIFTVELAGRSGRFRTPISRVESAATPRVLAFEALARLESCAAFAVERAGEQEFLASITEFDPTTPWKPLEKPAADGRKEPLRARIELGRFGEGSGGAEPTRASPVSLRAHSLGGVTLARGNPNAGDILLAWSGLDAGVPQIFLTVVSKQGVRMAQRMLTHEKKRDLAHVVAVDVGDGWIIAWADDRHGDLEVFATKVDRSLNRKGVEQRITEAPGAVSDLALAFDGTSARLVWAEARSEELPGHGDIFSVLLDPREAKPLGSELSVAITRAHSFSPGVQADSQGFSLTWAERGDKEERGIGFARVTREGTLTPPVLLSTADDPRSVGIACAENACRLAAILEGDTESYVAVSSFADAAPPSALTQVRSLLDGRGAAVPPVIRGDDIFFVDADAKAAVIRRMRLAW